MRYRRNWIVPKGKELTDMDRKILFYQEHGHLVPSPKLIKTPEQIEGIRRSGKINTGVLDLVEKEIHAGMSTIVAVVSLVLKIFPMLLSLSFVQFALSLGLPLFDICHFM